MNNIIIIQTAWLGDVILTTGIIESVHAAYPQARIDLIIQRKWIGVFERHPFIQHIYGLDKSNKWSSIRSIVKATKTTTYDLLINTHRYLSSGYLAWRIRSRKKIGYKQNPLSFIYDARIDYNPSDKRHETERLYDLLVPLGTPDKKSPRLFPPQKTSIDLPKDFICIAPCSAWPTKMLPVDKWVSFIHSLPPALSVVCVGGDLDYSYCEQLQTKSNRSILNTCGKVSFLESAFIMSKAKRCYVLDSASLHICSALNLPVTAFFLSTSPELGFSPLSDDAMVIQTDKKLPCKPCGSHGKSKCPEGHFKCAEITVETQNH